MNKYDWEDHKDKYESACQDFYAKRITENTLRVLLINLGFHGRNLDDEVDCIKLLEPKK